MTFKPFAVLAGAAALGLAACTHPDGTPSPQATGAAVGAVGGAAAGQLLGGDTRSTVVGAGLGGVTGAIVGGMQEDRGHQGQPIRR